MKPVFDLCTPRDEVLKGELREDIFAARLKDVIDGRADPIYGDPATFFENTYPTAGLKTLLGDALGRLIGSGAGKNAVIRLETAFGGGKTHNLIALYHVASGKAPAKAIDGLLGEKVTLPRPGDIKIAGVIGSDLDPALGMEHAKDKIKTYTLWGELAYQLGGRAGYALARESDEAKVAPGTSLFDTLVGDQPTLIMIDEIARHLRSALAMPTANKRSNLADQTTAFLMTLLEFAVSKEHCLVVLTLAGQADAFASETQALRSRLSEALSVSSRQERVLTPTDEGEISAIVTHRLFRHVDRAAAQEVVDAYARYYGDLAGKNADLPQRATRADYAQEMLAAYPFHPELLNTLNRKTATIPNFNQTRGALRLLAWTVRALWAQRDPGAYAIHPYHLDLSQVQIADDLTGRLDRPKFKQVIEADVVSIKAGSPAHATEVDQPLVAVGKPPYARRLATTVFLHSLTQGIASGVDPADLLLAVLAPDGGSAEGGDDPAVVNRALERLYDSAWFLEYDGHHYRFKTEPSINKIIADEMALVGPTKAKAEVEGRVRQIWKKGFFQPVYFPSEPVDVDDDASLPKLVIVHFDAASATAAGGEPPELVRRIDEHKGIMQAFREYQNNLVFLVADADQVDNMVGVARRYLAIGRILGDAERMSEFNDEQRGALKKLKGEAELDVRVAITKAYRYLYYPASDAPKSHGYLRRETLPAQEQGDVDKDQSNAVLRLLRSLNKVLTADDPTQSAAYVKSKAWDQSQQSMTTEDLRKAFARKISLRILLDVGQLRKTIANGVQTGTWLYYDAAEQFAYDKDSPPTTWQVGDQAILYMPEEAARLNLRIKGKWKPEVPPDQGGTKEEELCPVCGRPQSQCICGVPPPGDKTIPARITAQGAVAQAFQQVIDQCQEHHVTQLSRLSILVDGTGKQIANDMRAIGLALPQFGKGKYNIVQDIVASYGKGGTTADSFQERFTGSWERYKRLKATAEALSQDADELKATMRVTADFDGDLDMASEQGMQQFHTIRDVLQSMGLGKVTVEAVPVPKES